MKLYIGTTKDNELVFIEWDKIDNEQRKTFSLTGGAYDSPKTLKEGEEEARKVLSSGDYWEDIGYINKDIPQILKSNIDFEAVAEQVLSSDGWENITGEYELLGDNEQKEEVYLNYSSGGQHKEEINNFKNLWINKDILKEVYALWDNEHLKPLNKNAVVKMEAFFEMYKKYTSQQEALNQYLKDIKD